MRAKSKRNNLSVHKGRYPFNPFRATVPYVGTSQSNFKSHTWGQASPISSSLFPKRDCGSKGVFKTITRYYFILASRVAREVCF